MAANMSEDIVGIQTFVDPSIPGFSATIKQRYSDFIVNEVDRENQAVHLTNYDLPQPDPENIKIRDQRIQEKEEKAQANMEMSDEDKLAELAAVLENDEETMAQVKKMLDSYGNDVEFVNLKPQEDKAKRTAIHAVVKERFAGRMVSETAEGTMRLRMFKKKDTFDRRGKSKTDTWTDLGGEFCRFCLFKENRETMEALNHITATLRVPGKVFSIAGTKDRRGVTSQWVTAHKVKAERLVGLNKNLHNMRIGNFSYVPKGLKLGDLNGNRFKITLRNVTVDSEETLTRSMTSLRDKGFINYFGMQRFGTGSVGTHQIGRAILRGEWSEAVDLIMKPRVGERADAEKARVHWDEKRDPQEALKMFPRMWVAETQILWSYKKAGHQKNHFEALGNIPRNLRMMYVHAYQSYVWNHMVTERIRMYGCDKAVVGDLVSDDKEALEATSSTTGGEEGSEKGPNFIRAKALTAEDVDQYTIYDVVLPVPGFDIIYPTHAIGDKYKELMAKDNLDPYQMRRANKEYSLPGSYRCIMSKPENVEWEILKYDEVDIPLTLTDLDLLNGAAKPVVVENGKYLALVLNLTLKSSQYATMAIREVCKQDTSAAFQSTLNAGEEESNSNAPSTDSSRPASGSVTPTRVGTPIAIPTNSTVKRDIGQVDGTEPAPDAKQSKA
ncbi:multisubstrate pseudouridine synthase 7 [Podila horticola]|nr:multisubstrate pseudouridine synthase 7 [Podila horticola]